MSETTGMSKQDLKEIFAANTATLLEVIKELKKPTEMEQKKLDAERLVLLQQNEERKRNSVNVKARQQVRHNAQRSCTHKHPNGDSHCVFIQERNGGYMICQKLQCIIRSGQAPENYKGNDIYDSKLFSEIWQSLKTKGADILE